MLDKTKFLFIAFLFPLLAATMQVSGQSKIDTDRPDQTESAFTIPKKFVQIEAGIVSQKETPQLFSYSVPAVLLKYGIAKNTELRIIGAFNYSRDKSVPKMNNEKNRSVEFGFKTALTEEKSFRPKTSFIAHASLQREAKSDGITTTHAGLNYRFTCQHTLSKKIALGYNIGMQWERLNAPPAYVYTISAGVEPGRRWYTYIESFGTIGVKSMPVNSADAGIAFYVNDNFKLDISAGLGLSSVAPKSYGSVGFSCRINTAK